MLHLTILGAGPAGLAAAHRLARRTDVEVRVVVLEKADAVGGMSRSFETDGLHLDFGSHRLHPACREDVLSDIQDLLGEDLLTRPRNGRIRMAGRMLKFPPNLLNLLFHCPPRFLLGVARDAVTKPFRREPAGKATFGNVLRSNLGRTMSESFYFPYARKLWGLEPDEISPKQAYVRVKTGGMGQLLRKAFAGLGLVPGGKAVFHYPRNGFGQIQQAVADYVANDGVEVRTGASVKRIHHAPGERFIIEWADGNGASESLETDLIFSTIPVTLLPRLLEPGLAGVSNEVTPRLSFRSVVLLYLVLPVPQFSPYDAHYIPEEIFPFVRVSEPKNYAARSDPPDRTGLCLEIPCAPEDPLMQMPVEELAAQMAAHLARAGLPLPAEPLAVHRRTIPIAYPVYRLGYEAEQERMLRALTTVPRLVVFGRSGFFVHDNSHLAMAMGYDAANCIEPDGTWNASRWSDCLEEFKSFVVED